MFLLEFVQELRVRAVMSRGEIAYLDQCICAFINGRGDYDRSVSVHCSGDNVRRLEHIGRIGKGAASKFKYLHNVIIRLL